MDINICFSSLSEYHYEKDGKPIDIHKMQNKAMALCQKLLKVTKTKSGIHSLIYTGIDLETRQFLVDVSATT